MILLPLDICEELERMFNTFWWCNNGKGIKWMRQDRLCKNNGAGGLGFKKLRNFNLAMLGK